MEDTPILVCYRVIDMPVPNAPGDQAPCVECGLLCWRAFGSPTRVNVLCNQCFARQVVAGDDDMQFRVTDEQRAELHARGFTDDEIAVVIHDYELAVAKARRGRN